MLEPISENRPEKRERRRRSPACAGSGTKSLCAAGGRATQRSQILSNVELELAAGQALALVGESGSGKTTLLRLVAGLSRPTSGEVWVAGEVQMVFQDPGSSLTRLVSWSENS